jgi:hypothetical protein
MAVHRPPRRALVLAGRRVSGDTLAEAAGLTHKALLPIAGVPMAVGVLRALAAVPGIERIGVSCDDPQLVARLEGLVSAACPGLRLEYHASGRSPAASLADYISSLDDGEVALRRRRTTFDDARDRRVLVERAEQCAADLVAGWAERVYRAKFPTGTRTFVRFADDAFSGANLFFLRAPAAARVADFWVRMEGAQRPWRLVSILGWACSPGFAGRLTVAAASGEAPA